MAHPAKEEADPSAALRDDKQRNEQQQGRNTEILSQKSAQNDDRGGITTLVGGSVLRTHVSEARPIRLPLLPRQNVPGFQPSILDGLLPRPSA
jgi:hypothetical protein